MLARGRSLERRAGCPRGALRPIDLRGRAQAAGCLALALIFAGALLGCGDAPPSAGDGAGLPDAGAEDVGAADGGAPEGSEDAGQDGATPDADEPEPDRDVGMGDAEPEGGEPEAPVDPRCAFSEPGDADKDRVVLLGHTFGAQVGESLTEIRALTLTAAGELIDEGARLDVGFKVSRIAFVPSGEVALVLGQRDELASVRVSGALDLEVIDRATLPSGDLVDLVVAEEGRLIFVVGSNVAETSGVSSIRVDCEGKLEVVPGAFLNIRLAQSMAPLPEGRRAVLLGGQAVFEPVDEDDLRLLERDGPGWRQEAAFDVFGDFVSADRVGLSPDGALLLVPNGSPFSEEGAQVAVVAVEGDALREVDRLGDLPDVREARFDRGGQTAILTLGEPGRVVVLAIDGQEVRVAQTLTRIGLAGQIAAVERGALDGTLLLPSVDVQEGSNVAQLRVEGPGQVADLGQLPLGEGGPNIPTAIGVQP